MERNEYVQAIQVYLKTLGQDELEVLLAIADRLAMGQLAYGPITDGKKDWKREAYEEFLDAAVYSAKGYVQERRPHVGPKEEESSGSKVPKGR